MVVCKGNWIFVVGDVEVKESIGELEEVGIWLVFEFL